MTVNPTAPAVSISGPGTVAEGTPYTLDLSATEPAGGAVGGWTINWGDGTAADPDIETIDGNPSAVTHLFATNPAGQTTNFTIQASVSDDSATPTAATPISVAVTAADTVFSVSGDASVDDGDDYTLVLTQTQGAPVQSWTINWGDGTIQTVPNTGPLVTHDYGPGGSGTSVTYPITVTATAADGSTVSPTSAPAGVTVALQDDLTQTAADLAPIDIDEVEPSGVTAERVHDLTGAFANSLDPGDIAYSIENNSDDTILSAVTLDGSELVVTPVADTYGYSYVTVEASDSAGDELDATVLVIVQPIEPGPSFIPDQNQTVANITLSGEPTYVDLWNYFTDLQDKSYLTYTVAGDDTSDPDGILGFNPDGTQTVDTNGFLVLPAAPTGEPGDPSSESANFTVMATDAAGLTVCGTFDVTANVGDGDNGGGGNPTPTPVELIAMPVDGVDGGSGQMTLSRTPDQNGNLPAMTVSYSISGAFPPNGIPLSGTLHFSEGSEIPDSYGGYDGGVKWTVTDPYWDFNNPNQGPESVTFDFFSSSDPGYASTSAIVTIEPSQATPGPSVTLTYPTGGAALSSPYYLPLDNGNENGNTAEQTVTIDNPSDGTPESVEVLSPIPNNQVDRGLQNTVNAGANGVVQATLTISYPGDETLGTLAFTYGADLTVWWHGAQNQYDRWVPLSEDGTSFAGVRSNTSYAMLIQGTSEDFNDGSDNLNATFTPSLPGGGTGSPLQANLPVNVFSVNVSISGPTEIVQGATSATTPAEDDVYYLDYTDASGNPIPDNDPSETQYPTGNDPNLVTATVNAQGSYAPGATFTLSIPSSIRAWDTGTKMLVTAGETFPADASLNLLIQAISPSNGTIYLGAELGDPAQGRAAIVITPPVLPTGRIYATLTSQRNGWSAFFSLSFIPNRATFTAAANGQSPAEVGFIQIVKTTLNVGTLSPYFGPWTIDTAPGGPIPYYFNGTAHGNALVENSVPMNDSPGYDSWWQELIAKQTVQNVRMDFETAIVETQNCGSIPAGYVFGYVDWGFGFTVQGAAWNRVVTNQTFHIDNITWTSAFPITVTTTDFFGVSTETTLGGPSIKTDTFASIIASVQPYDIMTALLHATFPISSAARLRLPKGP